MAKEKKKPSHPNFTRDDILTGAILVNAAGIPCRVDRVEHETVFMTVLDDKNIDGKQVVEMSITELVRAQWHMKKKAKAA